MHRRRFLAAAALSTTALAAGCTADGPTDDATETSSSTTATTAASATSETTTRTQVGVSDVWVDRSFTYLHAGAHRNAYTVTGDGPLFVFASVPADARPTLELDGSEREPAGELPGGTTSDAAFFGREEDGRNILAYELADPVDASAGRIAEKPLTDSQLSALADPPTLRVESVTIPERVQGGQNASGVDVPISNEVRNDGGTDGRFRATATSSDYTGNAIGSASVPAGGAVTLNMAAPFVTDGDIASVTWGSDGRSETVAVES